MCRVVTFNRIVLYKQYIQIPFRVFSPEMYMFLGRGLQQHRQLLYYYSSSAKPTGKTTIRRQKTSKTQTKRVREYTEKKEERKERGETMRRKKLQPDNVEHRTVQVRKSKESQNIGMR